MTGCPGCGHPPPPATSPARIVVLDLWNADDLRCLPAMDGRHRCAACGTPLALPQAYVLRDLRNETAAVDVYVPADCPELLAAVAATAPRMRRARTPARFRRNVVGTRLGALRVVRDFLAGRSLRRADLLAVDPPGQLIAELLAEGRLEGAERHLGGGRDRERLDELRQRRLLALAEASTGDDLAADVRRVLAPGFVRAADLRPLRRRLAVAGAEDLDPARRYVMAAVHAIGCAYAGEANPRSTEWAWLYCATEVAIRSDRADLLPLRLPAELVRDTMTYQNLWDVIGQTLAKQGPDLGPLPTVLDELGRGQVVWDFLRHGIRPRLTTRTPQDLADILERQVPDDRDRADLARIAFRGLAAEGRIDDLERFLDLILGPVAGRPEAVARLLKEFAEACKEAGLGTLALRRIGATAGPGESELSAEVRISLAVERSNALRLVGQTRAALAMLDDLRPEVSGPDLRIVDMNRAILLRTLGRPDLSVRMLRELLTGTEGRLRLNLLESLAVSYQEMGMAAEVVEVKRESLLLAAGPWADREAVVRIGLVDEGHRPATVAELTAQGVPDDTEKLSTLASQWSGLIDEDAVEAARQAAREFLVAAAGHVDQAAGIGNVYQALALARNCAFLAERLGEDDEVEHWQRELDLYPATTETDPVPMLSVAALRLAAGDAGAATRQLIDVPTAMSARLGGVADPSTLPGRTFVYMKRLWQLAETARTSGAEPALLRLIADLQRDSTGRAMLCQRLDSPVRDLALLRDGLGDEVVARLARPGGDLHVVEWLDLENGYDTLVTSIGPDGRVTFDRPRRALAVGLRGLADHLHRRLDGWSSTDPRDPFDLPDWQVVEDWTRQLIPASAAGRPHVVIMDHAEHHGLPWHAVRDAPWTVSYAPSWSSLLSAPQIDRSALRRIGLVSVPTHDDQVTETFRQGAERLAELCARTGRELVGLHDERADPPAVSELLGSVDVALLFCHGFRSAEEDEIAFVLASDGRLPPSHAVAADSSLGRAGRWSWRDSLRLHRAPRLLLSAACSTGGAHVRGLGERLGMYGALRLNGTAAVVAPSWDALAADSCRMTVDVLDGFLGGAALPAAVGQAAAVMKARAVPHWRAANLITEGFLN